MFDIGGTEILVIGVVALIVVGPKDLPGMFRTLGRFTAKIKGMAREFQDSMNAAADEAGVKDISKDLREMSSPTKFGMNKVTDAVKEFEKWTPSGDAPAKGPATAKLSEERAEAARKIQEKTAKVVKDREAAEAAAAAKTAAPEVSDPALAAQRAADAAKPAPKTAAKTAAKKAPAKKPAAKKPAAKKPAAKKPAAKTASKPAAKKTATRKKTTDTSKA